MVRILKVIAILCMLAGLAFGQSAINTTTKPAPELPQVYVNTTWAPPNGTLRPAHTAAQLQTALNVASPGDTIVLDAGETYIGNFNLPGNTSTPAQWIYIESSNLALLPGPGEQVGPADAANMARIVTPNSTAAFTLMAAANHYRLVGLEITTTSTQGGNHTATPPVNPYTYYLVGWQSNTTVLPDSITIDRCYIHGSPTQDVRQGVQANGTNFAVIDSYISDIHQSTADSQAVLAYWTPGPIKIVGNYLEATTENIMIGGAGGFANPFIPSDIDIENNLLFKNPAWDKCGAGGTLNSAEFLPNGQQCPAGVGYQWVVKNNLEFKSARRVLVQGNTLQNNWKSAQTGVSLLFTIRTSQSGNLAVVDDITVQNNKLLNVDAGFNTLTVDDQCGAQYGYPNCTNPGESKRIKIENNLVVMNPEVNGSHHAGLFVAWHFTDFIFQHNTAIMSDGSKCWAGVYFNVANGQTWPLAQSGTTNVWILDNAICRQTSGDWGGQGTTGLNSYMSAPAPMAPRYFGNVMFVPSGDRVQTWPAANDATATPLVFAPNYQLTTPLWTQTTDGKPAGIFNTGSVTH
jgi:hypothetical protein